MHRNLLIALLLVLGSGASAQDSLRTIDGTVNAFFEALQDSSASQRTDRLERLLLRGARMNSIAMVDRYSSRIALGGPGDFLENAKAFYATYDIALDEYAREVDYYADLASVNSLVFQTVERKSDSQRFEQKLWYALDLVYQDGRWYIAQATWTTSNGVNPVEFALPADTLWHRVERR